MHRSIKDDPEPAIGTPAPAPKHSPLPKTAVVVPPAQPQPPRVPAGKRAELPNCASSSDCMVRLKAMIDDSTRSWIGKAQSPAEYANGTRLFAYRALRNQLTCSQLNAAIGEIASAPSLFRTDVAGVSNLQVKRVLTLNADVERELRAEFAGRCKS